MATMTAREKLNSAMELMRLKLSDKDWQCLDYQVKLYNARAKLAVARATAVSRAKAKYDDILAEAQYLTSLSDRDAGKLRAAKATVSNFLDDDDDDDKASDSTDKAGKASNTDSPTDSAVTVQ